jgi:hypothetical protein
MKTIFDKLSPEIKADLENQLEIYPTLTQRIIDDCAENVVWGSLKMRTVRELCLIYERLNGSIYINNILHGDEIIDEI